MGRMILNTRWLLGIDGGGSCGRLLAVDENGAPLAYLEVGPLNVNNVDASKIVSALASGLDILESKYGLARIHLRGVFAGVAGIKDQVDGGMFETLMRQVFVHPGLKLEAANDIVILQSSGLAGRPGVALILGTGSHCYGQNVQGESVTCGGWGYLMDDCGAGYAIGLAAMRDAVRMWDGRKPTTKIAAMVMEHLGVALPEASLRRVYNTDFCFDDVKAIAPKVTCLAAVGDPGALEILRAAAEEAAGLVEVVCRKLDLGSDPEVVVTGGVALDETFRQLLLESLHRYRPGATILESALPPSAGAVICAARSVGISVDAAFLSHLSEVPKSPTPM